MGGERQIAYLWTPYLGATLAQRVEPRLDGRPLVLLDEQDRVLATDPLAARAGVVPMLSGRQATVHCPDAVLLPASRFPLQEAQDQLLEHIKAYTDRWQPEGLGCAYLDATHAGNSLLRWSQAVAGAVRGLGWKPILGITASKFGANVAGQAAGENTGLLVAPAVQRAFLASQPTAALPLDTDALLQLRHLGIRTLEQFARLPAVGVLTRFGLAGRTAQRWALGLDDRPVIPPWEAPEVSARVEFDPPLADRERLLLALTRQAGKLLAPLRAQIQVVSRIVLSVTRSDGRTVPGSHIFPLPTAAAGPVGLGLAAALDRVSWQGEGATDVTLTLAGVTDAPAGQLALFETVSEGRARLTATLEQLAVRFGPDAFRLATLVDPDNPLPERRTSWRTFDE